MLNEIIEGWKNVAFQNQQVDEIAVERAKICSGCDAPVLLPKFVFNILKKKLEDTGMQEYKCSDCGCPLAAKCRSLSSQCPRNKWPKINYMQAITILIAIEDVRNELLIGRVKMTAHYPDLSKEINDLFKTPVMKVQELYEEISFKAFGEDGGAVKQEYENITPSTNKITTSIYSTVDEQVKQGVVREIDKLFYEMGKAAVILDQKSSPIDFKTSKINEVLSEVKEWVKDLSEAFDFSAHKDKFDEFEEKLNKDGASITDPLFNNEVKTDEEEPISIVVEDETLPDESGPVSDHSEDVPESNEPNPESNEPNPEKGTDPEPIVETDAESAEQ